MNVDFPDSPVPENKLLFYFKNEFETRLQLDTTDVVAPQTYITTRLAVDSFKLYI